MSTRLVGVGQQVRVVSECGNWGHYGNILTVVEDNSIDLNHTVDLDRGVIEQYTVTHRYPDDFEVVKPTYSYGGWLSTAAQIGETVCETVRSAGRVGPVKSDGGSSSYYDIPLPPEFIATLMERLEEGNPHVRTEELIRYVFGNDFSFGTAFKSMVRAYGITQGGGKEGNDINYECSKIEYYAKHIRAQYGETPAR